MPRVESYSSRLVIRDLQLHSERELFKNVTKTKLFLYLSTLRKTWSLLSTLILKMTRNEKRLGSSAVEINLATRSLRNSFYCLPVERVEPAAKTTEIWVLTTRVSLHQKEVATVMVATMLSSTLRLKVITVIRLSTPCFCKALNRKTTQNWPMTSEWLNKKLTGYILTSTEYYYYLVKGF